MNKFGFKWPESLACEKFPVDTNLCVGENKTSSTPATPPHPAGILPEIDYHHPPASAPIVSDYPCPQMMQVTTSGRDSTLYALTFDNQTVDQCSFSCGVDAARPVSQD
jgi:hypothetical protein